MMITVFDRKKCMNFSQTSATLETAKLTAPLLSDLESLRERSELSLERYADALVAVDSDTDSESKVAVHAPSHQALNPTFDPAPSAAVAKKPLPSLTDALKQHYREYFADWFEPGTQAPARGETKRRSSRKKNLHQKLVLSQMNTKKASRLDMDDRAKMTHYFSKHREVKNPVESVRIEAMFGACWSVPRAGPPLPTVITVQAPAGIGKSSMLKYMCMKWGCSELWAANFDALIFVECRTLNRLGPMTGREFMAKLLENVEGKVNLGEDEAEGRETSSMTGEEKGDVDKDEQLLNILTRKAGAGRVLLLLDGLDEIHGVGNLAYIRQPAGQPERPGLPGKGALTTTLSPLEFAQCLLTGALLQGCHVIVTSRPHTLSHLQSSRWFLSLPKRMVSLDIQGLSEEGVQSFIHRYPCPFF